MLDLTRHSSHIVFQSGEPFKSILKMLFSYVNPEATKNVESIEFLKKIRGLLMQILIKFLSFGTKEALDIYVESLQPTQDKNYYHLRDALYSLMVFLYKRQQKQPEEDFVFEYFRSVFIVKPKNNLIDTLLLLIHRGISQRTQYNTLRESEVEKMPNDLQEVLKCTDMMLGYALFILFSFNCGNLFFHSSSSFTTNSESLAEDTSSPTSKLKKMMSNNLINLPVITHGEMAINLLNPSRGKKGSFTNPEEIILNFLFHRLLSLSKKPAKYIKFYLSFDCYYCLMSQMLWDSSSYYYNEESGIDKGTRIINCLMKATSEKEYCCQKVQLIYPMIIMNLKTFEVATERKILSDLGLLLKSCSWIRKEITEGGNEIASIGSDAIYNAIIIYLLKDKHWNIVKLKPVLENIFLMLTMCYWLNINKRKVLENAFKKLLNLKEIEIVRILNLIMDNILTSPNTYLTPVGAANLIESLYFIEDAINKYPEMSTKSDFFTLILKITLLLNASQLLYFSYPSFSYRSLQVNATSITSGTPLFPPIENTGSEAISTASCNSIATPGFIYQREGGVARIMIKILFLMLKKANGEAEHSKNLAKLLSYYIFHKRKTIEKLSTNLFKLSLPAAEIYKDILLQDTQSGYKNYFEYKGIGVVQQPSSTSTSSISAGLITSKDFPQTIMKVLLQDKPMVQRSKSLEQLIKSVKQNTMESASFKCFMLFTYLSQLFIYEGYSIENYNHFLLPLTYKGHKISTQTSYKLTFLGKLIGKILKAKSSINSGLYNMTSEFLEDGSLNGSPSTSPSKKESQLRFTWEIDTCFSNFDLRPKEVIDRIVKLKESSGIAILPLSPEKEEDKEDNGGLQRKKSLDGKEFKAMCFKLYTDIFEIYSKFTQKEINKDNYTKKLMEMLHNIKYIKEVQPRFHELIGVDFIVIEKCILLANSGNEGIGSSGVVLSGKTNIGKAHVKTLQKEYLFCDAS